MNIISPKMLWPFSLTPGFSPVCAKPPVISRFNGLPREGKPLKRLALGSPTGTGLKPGVNERLAPGTASSHKLSWIICVLVLSSQVIAVALDVSGVYRIDPATLRDHPVPTNFYAFSITLNTNGTFVATNVPADFFFDYTPTPAASEARGTWKVRHTSDGSSGFGSWFYTGENDYLDLMFTEPYSGSCSYLIQIYWGAPRFRMDYHARKADSAWFYLLKQK